LPKWIGDGRNTDSPVKWEVAILIRDRELFPIWEKIKRGERLDARDGLRLFESDDLLGLGLMANWLKEKKTGNFAFFVLNRQINPTNICVLSCRFCDYATKKNRPGAYALSEQQIIAGLSEDIKEVHITSALNNDWDFGGYLRVVELIKERFPHIQIKAYTAVEIDYFARREKTSVANILKRLMAAGVVCLPGGGAEVFSERVRKSLFPFKIGASRWLEIHRAAHQMGLKSNATMLYGHIETYEERLAHLLKLRELQDETRGFLSFVPLAYQPGRTKVVPRQASPTEDLKTIAVSRLLLDNFDHIKAYWVTMGEDTASAALYFGADDLDGTVGGEKIMHAAEASSPAALTRELLVKLITEAGRIPVERDCLYNVIRAHEPVQEAVNA